MTYTTEECREKLSEIRTQFNALCREIDLQPATFNDWTEIENLIGQHELWTKRYTDADTREWAEFYTRTS